MKAQNFFILLELLLVFSSEGTFYGSYLAHCQLNSHDIHDVVFLEQIYFNKILLVQYNSTLGKVVGYTKVGQTYADILNKMPRFLSHQIWKTIHCKRSVQLAYEKLLTPVYPKQIRVTWLRDGKEVTSDVTSTDKLPNGNWLHQIHSYLEFTPKAGEKITCMVEHASLREPKLYEWEPEQDSGKNILAIGSAGLLLGLLFSVTGFLYYKKKSLGRVIVPTTESIYPENNL